MKLLVWLALLCLAFCYSVPTTNATAVKSCFINAGTFDATDQGTQGSCTGIQSCVMYTNKTSGKFVRACSIKDKATACENLDSCTPCNSNDCNGKPFKLNCHKSSANIKSDLGSPAECSAGICAMIVENGGNYKRFCVDIPQNDCPPDSPKNCAKCTSEKCNKGHFTTCYDNTHKNTVSPVDAKLCPSGTCIMYQEGDSNYIRGCADDIKKNCASKKGSPCAECTSENCNKSPFIKCYDNTHKDTVSSVDEKLCPSGTCIMYKDSDNNYKRGCADDVTENCKKIGGNCAECTSENCNKSPFTTCHESNSPNATIKGEAKLCPSGTCIMYKDGDNNYIRSCVDDSKTCKKLKATASLCYECSESNCNEDPFVSVCLSYSGPSATDLGVSPVLCKSGTCLSYHEAKNYVRGCHTKGATTDKNPCTTDSCNNTPLPIECHEYNGTDTVEKGAHRKNCNSGQCIMYQENNSGNYIRSCVDDLKTCEDLGQGASLCNECSEKECNEDPFISVCQSYNGNSATDLGTPVLCESGTCLSYHDGKNYVRGCHTNEQKAGQKLCTQDNCNIAPFTIKCHKYSGTNKTETGSDSEPCPSGKCIRYKDTTTSNYIRGCVDATITCSKLTVGNKDTLCTECSAENCNKDPFVESDKPKSGSSFSLDARMATIALAGSLIAFRSL